MDVFPHPPWDPAPDETKVADAGGFEMCLAHIDALTSRMNARMTNPLYSVSKQWGNIVRATIQGGDLDPDAKVPVICWLDGGKSRIAVVADGCCGG